MNCNNIKLGFEDCLENMRQQIMAWQILHSELFHYMKIALHIVPSMHGVAVEGKDLK
jgi:hypothetical protein